MCIDDAPSNLSRRTQGFDLQHFEGLTKPNAYLLSNGCADFT